MEVTYGSVLTTTAEDSSGQSLMISEADVTAAATEVMGAEVISAALVMNAEDADSGSVSERISEVIWAEVISGALVLGERMTFSVSTKEEGGPFPMTIRKLSCQRLPQHRVEMGINEHSPCIGNMRDNKMSDNWRMLLARIGCYLQGLYGNLPLMQMCEWSCLSLHHCQCPNI